MESLSDFDWLDGHKHCDEYIDDETQPECLRKFLYHNRLPAVDMYKRYNDPRFKSPELYARLKQKKVWLHDGGGAIFSSEWVRIKMASRLGDVGISTNLDTEHGYDIRVPVDALMDFTDKRPGENGESE